MPIEPIIFEEHGIPVELLTDREVRKAISGGRLKPETIVRIGGDDGTFVVRCARDVELLKPYFGTATEAAPEPAASAVAEPPDPEPAEAPAIAAETAESSLPVTVAAMASEPVQPWTGSAPERIHSPAADAESDDFWASALLPLKRYADFSGRSRRKEFWSFAALQFGAAFILLLLTGGLLLVLAVVALIIPNLAVTVRRLHDQDRSGWFILVNFIPYIGWLILLGLMVVEGTPGPNRFGPDPRVSRLPDIFR